jgi:hypothetical protein
MGCPNKNLQDWVSLVDKLGEDGAYYVYMKNGEKVPYLQGEKSNRFIWDVENKLGLVSWKQDNGKNTKKYKGFGRDETARIVKNIRDTYVGNYIIKHIAPDGKGEYGIKIEGYPISKKLVEDYARETYKDSVEAERDYLEYMEFKQRMEDANENIIPIEHSHMSNILYDNDSTVGYRNGKIVSDGNIYYQNNSNLSDTEYIASEKTIRDLAERMADRIGLQVRYESDRTKDYKGKLEGNTAVINLAYATLDTPIHEILGHPIIRALKTGTLQNKQLYQKLLKELETGKGKEVLDRIKRDYKYKDSNVDYQKIQNEFGERYWRKLYLSKKLSNYYDFQYIDIPSINNKFKPDFENVYHGTNNFELDSNGNLILTPSNNFKNKTTSISFTQIPVVAQDYMLRKRGNKIIKIKNNALPNYEVESAEEIAINTNKSIIIPKGSYEIITVPLFSDKKKLENKYEIDQKTEEKINAFDIIPALINAANDMSKGDEFSEIQGYTGGDMQEKPDWYVADEYMESLSGQQVISKLTENKSEEDVVKLYLEYYYNTIKQSGNIPNDKIGNPLYGFGDIFSNPSGFKLNKNIFNKLYDPEVEEKAFEFYNSEEQVNRRSILQKEYEKRIEETLKKFKDTIDEIDELPFQRLRGSNKKTGHKYTLEEQLEEALVELLGLYTADRLDRVKDKNLISLLKQLWQQMTDYIKSLFSSKEINISELKLEMTLGNLADLLAYGDSNIILPGNEVTYITPDESTFQKVSNTVQSEQFSKQQLSELETILRHTMPSIKEVIWDRKLEVKGRLEKNGVIRINPDTMTKDTIGHEFAHLLIDLRGGLNDPFIKAGLEQLYNTERAQKIRETYKDQPDEVIQKEILADAIGNEIVDLFETENDLSNFEKWLLRFFRWLGSRMGITKNNARKLASDLLKGKPLDSSKYTGKQSPYVQNQMPDGDITDEEMEAAGVNIEEKEDPRIRMRLDEYNRVRQKATNIIGTRITRARSGGRIEELNDLEELSEKLLDESNRDKNAIIQFAVNAADYINKEFNIYNTKLEKENNGDDLAFEPRDITRWNTVMTSYDILDDIVKFMTDSNFLGTSGKLEGGIIATLKSKLQDVIAKKNTLKELYKTTGSQMLAKAFTRISTNVEIEIRDSKMAEFREAHLDEVGSGKKYTRKEFNQAQKDYADQYVKENYNDIKKQTRLALEVQNKIASEDVSVIERYLDTMLDTNDMVLAAAVKQIVIKDGIARRKAIEFKNKAHALVTKLYDESGYKWAKTNVVDVYSYMLEKDTDGKRTGYIINKFSSEMMNEYEREKKRNAHLPFDEARKKNNNWWSENNPLDKKAYNSAIQEYLDELVAKHMLTKNDVDLYWEIQQQPYNSRPLYRNVFDTNSTEAADLIERQEKILFMEHSNPISKWENKQWPAFEKELKANPDSAKSKFYNLIMDKIAEVNSQLPHDKRKYGQLPFKLKDIVERHTNGEKVDKLLLEEARNLTQRRLDDTEFGMYTDENDKPIDYLPWHYNRPTSTHEHEVKYKLKVNSSKEVIASSRKKEFKTYTKIVRADSAEEAREKVITNVIDIDPDSIKIKLSKSIAWTDKDQSYDLMGLYYDYFKMADRYIEMNNILPEIELTKLISENREFERRDSMGNKILKKLGKESTRPTTKKGIEANINDMFRDFVKMSMYGQSKEDEGSFDILGWKYDYAKMADNLNKYAAYTMLGGNMIQGLTNVGMGELQQVIESIAGQYLNFKDLHKATVEYGREMPIFLGDIGEVVGRSKITHLNEQWDILNEYENGEFKKNSRFARNMTSSVLFWQANAGEHFMQTRIMIAMLSKVPAYNSKGESIKDKSGKVLSMYDLYSVKDKELVLDPRVDLEKSNWDIEAQELFGAKVKRLLARLHGEYSYLGKNAAQRFAIGRMGMMFRKFIVPGFKKRWGRRKINIFTEDYTEGSYRQMFKFMGNSLKELRALGLATFTENWKLLSPDEQSNLIRGVSEFGFGILLSIMAGAFLTLRGESDDDKERYMYALAANLTLRMKSETLFFLKPDEALTIIKSPAVATAMIENIIKLIGQMWSPFDEYERGSWKDYPKILKTTMNLIPGVKQYYKVKNIEDSLVYFTK